MLWEDAPMTLIKVTLPEEPAPIFEIQISHPITARRLGDLMCTGMESPYSPWLANVEPVSPFQEIEGDDTWYYSERFFSDPDFRFKASFDGNDDEEGSFGSSKEVGLDDVKKALQLMAEHNKDAFRDFVDETDDAGTADVFLQYLFLGEEIYG